MRASLIAAVAGSFALIAAAFAPGCGDKTSDSPKPEPAGATGVSQQTIVSGRNTFLRTCASCHGADAKGMPNNGKDLTASEFVRTQTDEQLFQYVLDGREVPGGVSMPPRGGFPPDLLTDDQIRDVIAYIRRFPGNRTGG